MTRMSFPYISIGVLVLRMSDNLYNITVFIYIYHILKCLWQVSKKTRAHGRKLELEMIRILRRIVRRIFGIYPDKSGLVSLSTRGVLTTSLPTRLL